MRSCELDWGMILQTGMRSFLVVVPTPRLDLKPRVGDVQEPVRRQALVAEPAVEAFNVGVLNGLAGLDEGQGDLVTAAPKIG